MGAQVERFLAPVEPGNLLLLAYKDDVPIISAPGCFRSAKPNVVDLVLPPLLARYRVTGWEVPVWDTAACWRNGICQYAALHAYKSGSRRGRGGAFLARRPWFSTRIPRSFNSRSSCFRDSNCTASKPTRFPPSTNSGISSV